MAKKVSASLEVETELKNKGITITVTDDAEILGYLEIGKASMKWTDKHGKKPDGTATWEQFIGWMKG